MPSKRALIWALCSSERLPKSPRPGPPATTAMDGPGRPESPLSGRPGIPGLPDPDEPKATAAEIGAKTVSLPSHSILTRVGSMTTTLASPTLSPALYHLPFIRASSPNMPSTTVTGLRFGGTGTNKFFFLRSSAIALPLAKCFSTSSSDLLCSTAFLTRLPALLDVTKKSTTLTSVKTANRAETPSSANETKCPFSFR